MTRLHTTVMIACVLPCALAALMLLIAYTQARIVGFERLHTAYWQLTAERIADELATTNKPDDVEVLRKALAHHAGPGSRVELRSRGRVIAEAGASISATGPVQGFDAKLPRGDSVSVRVYPDDALGSQRVSTLAASAWIGCGIVLLVTLTSWQLRRIWLKPLRGLIETMDSDGRIAHPKANGPHVTEEVAHLAAGIDRLLTANRAMQSNALQSGHANAEQMFASVRQARAAEQAKSGFIASVGHHFRQPLQALDLLIGGMETDATSEQQGTLRKMRHSVGSMTRLLDAMLEISHLDAGVVTPTIRTLEISDALALERSWLDAHALRCNVVLAWRIPSLTLRTDPMLVSRILRCLAVNAIDQSRGGRVLIAAWHRSRHVRIEVLDNGPGIAPIHHRRIFDEFVQIDDRVDGSPHGYGLGLAIASRIACLLGTRIELRSELDRGSRFWFDLPLASRANPDGDSRISTGRHSG